MGASMYNHYGYVRPAREVASEGQQRSLVLETRERAKDGRIFPVEVACSYLEHGGRERCFAFVQDITERKRSEESQGS